MGIPDEDVARVKEATDLAALIGEHVALRRSGRRFVGLCPFHSEKSPSFSVNPELGFYFCFGCQASGDAISFVRAVEGLDFVEAVERLASRAGVSIRIDESGPGRVDRQRRDRLYQAVDAAARAYHELLLEGEQAGGARRYLRSRGFDGEVVRRFQLGYAPDDWDWLSRALQRSGIGREELVEAGLAFVNRANRLQDVFRGRLLFPIADREGRPIGFGGRILDSEGPKYKNTAETPIYHKSRVLYGLHRAKSEIVARDEVIVCEGYTDVMAFDLVGLDHAVATCGTALAEEHIRILEKLTPNVVLAYDADAAGQAAVERCYQWEQEHEVRFRVAALPKGSDPADAWHDDPASLEPAIRDAQPLLEFRIDRRLAGSDTGTFEARARSAEAVAALVAEHPNELVRDQYAVEVADRLDIDVERLRDTIDRVRGGEAAPRRRRRRPVPSVSDEHATAAATGADRVELEALRWAVHEPALVADLLGGELFRSDAARAAFAVLAASPTLDEAVATADPETRELLLRLAVEEPQRPDTIEVVDDGAEADEGASGPIGALRAVARSHAPVAVDRARQPRRVAREVVAQLAADRVRERLARLTRDDPDRAEAMTRALNDLADAQRRDDDEDRDRAVESLVSWVVAG